jgi:hypothetical protein
VTWPICTVTAALVPSFHTRGGRLRPGAVHRPPAALDGLSRRDAAEDAAGNPALLAFDGHELAGAGGLGAAGDDDRLEERRDRGVCRDRHTG